MYTKDLFLIGQSGGALVLLAALFASPPMQALGQLVNESSSTGETNMASVENFTNTTGATVSNTSSTTTGTLVDVSIIPGSSILTDTAFQPNPVSIKVGDIARWTNDDNMIHTVIEGNPATGNLPEEGFESELMNTGQTFDHTFNQTGTFDYYCTLHPNMIGQVMVS
jgi:plastocyanin